MYITFSVSTMIWKYYKYIGDQYHPIRTNTNSISIRLCLRFQFERCYFVVKRTKRPFCHKKLSMTCAFRIFLLHSFLKNNSFNHSRRHIVKYILKGNCLLNFHYSNYCWAIQIIFEMQINLHNETIFFQIISRNFSRLAEIRDRRQKNFYSVSWILQRKT